MGFKKAKTKEELEQEALLASQNSQELVDENDEKIETNDKVDEQGYVIEDGVSETIESSEKEKSLAERINEKRNEHIKYTKKLKIINYVVTGALFVVLVICLVLALTLGNSSDGNNSYVTIIVLVVAVLLLIGTFVFSKLQRKQIDKSGNTYAMFIYEEAYKIIYDVENSESKFKDVTFNLKENVNDIFLDAKMYTKINQFKALNVISGKALVNDGKEVEFKAFDCAAITAEKGQRGPKFVGRVFVFDFTDKYESGMRVLYQKKGGKLSIPVDDIEDLTCIENNPKYIYYVSKPEYKNVLCSKSIKLINSIKLDKNIIDVICAINNNKLYIGIDYSDEFINLPTDTPYNESIISKAKKDVETVTEIVEAIYHTNKDVEKIEEVVSENNEEAVKEETQENKENTENKE